MFEFDPLILARIQFAFTISFHIIFPAFTIGLASYLAVLEGMYLYKGELIYKELYKFWIKIFAVAFGMGVVSGVVMSYQFGTNWSIFSDKVANVIGPIIGFEVLTAFFLEASFLGIMLFGWDRVSRGMHFFATCIVAIGTLISAFWILSANSWMQTPTGFYVGEEGILYPRNWLEIIFNPSFPYRFAHMISAAYLTTAFVVGGIGALYLITKKYQKHAQIMFANALFITTILAPMQLIIGDMHGLNTLEHQPVKVAAMEGIWENEKGAALRLFAIPDANLEQNHFEISIPKATSLILTHSLDGEVKGLKSWPKEDRPPVGPVFWSFRIMVGIGICMILLSVTTSCLYFKKTLWESSIILKTWIIMIPSGFIALLAGWFVTEIGRQPFTAYGIIRTAESVSPGIYGAQVLFSLVAFVVIYTFVFGAGIYYIYSLISKGIKVIEDKEQFYAHSIEASIMEEGKNV